MDSVEQRPRQEVNNLIGTLHLLLGLDLHNHDAKTHLVFIFFAFYNCKSIWRHGILMLPGNTTGGAGEGLFRFLPQGGCSLIGTV